MPINKAKRILTQLIKGEKILYGWLGVSIQDLNPDLRSYFGIQEREGVIVTKLFKNSPAEKGNMKEGDLILTFNNRVVTNTRELIKLVTLADVGEVVPVGVLRDGKQVELKIKIGARRFSGTAYHHGSALQEVRRSPVSGPGDPTVSGRHRAQGSDDPDLQPLQSEL